MEPLWANLSATLESIPRPTRNLQAIPRDLADLSTGVETNPRCLRTGHTPFQHSTRFARGLQAVLA